MSWLEIALFTSDPEERERMRNVLEAGASLGGGLMISMTPYGTPDQAWLSRDVPPRRFRVAR